MVYTSDAYTRAYYTRVFQGVFCKLQIPQIPAPNPTQDPTDPSTRSCCDHVHGSRIPDAQPRERLHAPFTRVRELPACSLMAGRGLEAGGVDRRRETSVQSWPVVASVALPTISRPLIRGMPVVVVVRIRRAAALVATAEARSSRSSTW